MRTPIIHKAGEVFGMWTVIGPGQKKGRATQSFWVCQCSCGKQKSIGGYSLRSGESLGCHECRLREASTVHGHYKTGTYVSWYNMLSRCKNPKSDAYRWYGGRGIKVCSKWLKFENFLADMGERPLKTTIDRINSDGDYEPGNCRWATWDVQVKNKRGRGDV